MLGRFHISKFNQKSIPNKDRSASIIMHFLLEYII